MESGLVVVVVGPTGGTITMSSVISDSATATSFRCMASRRHAATAATSAASPSVTMRGHRITKLMPAFQVANPLLPTATSTG